MKGGDNLKYSILITAYESKGKAVEFIRNNLEKIISQRYRPIEVIISDQSKDDLVENEVKKIDNKGIEVVYKRYNKNYGNPCENWNNALKYSKGDLIHYLALDDYLSDELSVQNIIDLYNNISFKWIAMTHKIDPTGDIFIPKWNDNILQNNTISGPSAIVISKSLKHIKLDPQFKCFLDLDWYYRLYKEAGKPYIYDKVTWINRHHPEQLSNKVCIGKEYDDEINKLKKKYGDPIPLSL